MPKNSSNTETIKSFWKLPIKNHLKNKIFLNKTQIKNLPTPFPNNCPFKTNKTKKTTKD